MTLSKPPRLTRIFQKYDPPLYFVTLCTDNRRNILANEKVHGALLEYTRAGVARGVALGRYVVMPDHIHLFVRGLKRVVAAAVSGGRNQRHAAETAASTTLWQRGFFDHVIRNTESYSQKWDYVRENPVRAGLASAADEWPFQGEIVLIEHR
jgi:REP element-mobilizing transposase RayT